MKIDFKLLILKNNSAIEIVYVLHCWLNEQCPVTSLPLGDSTSSGPRGKSPKSAHLLTYSQPSTLRPQQAQAPFLLPRRSSETQRAGVATEGSSSVGRAASLVVSPVRPPPKCRATRELETATTAVVGRPGRISEVLVTSKHQAQRIPGHSSG